MSTLWSQRSLQKTVCQEQWGWLCPEELPTPVSQNLASWQHHLPQLRQETSLVCQTQEPCQCLEAVTNLPQWGTSGCCCLCPLQQPVVLRVEVEQVHQPQLGHCCWYWRAWV